MSILNVNKINPVGGGSTVTIAGIASVTTSVIAPSFVGNVTGNVTGNADTASGLSGNPSINTTGIITATNVSVGSSVTAATFHGNGANLTGLSVNTNSLQVLEQFYLLCDGRSVSTSNGTVTTTDVTAVQALTDSFVEMNGSSLTYTPPTGTTEIIYEYKAIVAEASSNNRLLYSWYLDIDGATILESRTTLMSATGGYAYDLSLKYGFRINTGGSNNATTGDRAALSSMTLKTMGRRWASSYAANVHQIVYYAGASPNTVNYTRRPYVGITAIGSV